MTKNMNPSENLTLSKFCERIESDNSNLLITHRKLKPLILMIWTFFHRIIFLKNRLGFLFRVKSTSHAVTVRFIEFCYRLSSVIFECPSF
jgi:hypothetical protein